ncbi:MAG: hypothetical protein EZS28_023830 [Streblomastix strix]|uniref:Right handed beta helix domain-containing protein n=1 Tax=Streblomastix strix TaxID=222440 RepID=A0A5J4VE43_9EUKA|nr:MAG: hypothetical protein EZS28_023830 [Streblomastix strix]
MFMCKTGKYQEGGDLGGSVNINGSLGAMINIKSVSFTSYSSEGGRELNTRLQSGSILNITDVVNFIFCESTSQNGGGIRAILTDPASSLYISGSSIFDECKTAGQGDGMFINANQSKIINLNSVLLDNYEAIQGRAISTLLVNGGTLTIEGLTNFTTCKTTGDTKAVEDLGICAVYTILSNVSSKFRIIDTVKLDQCESTKKGGAIYVKDEMSQLIETNKATFDRCICTKEGGGIYSYISNEGSFIFTNGSTFTQCKSISYSGDTIFTGCYSVIPGMRVVAQEQNELYSNQIATYDEVYKHGLIYLESLTGGDKSGISQFSI